MSSILDVFCTWNREVISVSGENSLYLLIEWRSGPPAKRQSKIMPKLLYRDVELLLKPEEGVTIKEIHGARAKETDAGWVLQMGSAYKGKTKTLLLELAVSSQSAGKKISMLRILECLQVETGAACSLAQGTNISANFGSLGAHEQAA